MVQFQAPNCPLAPPDITVENAQFVYMPNFEGREERFNNAGDRYFNLLIPENILEQVKNDGWNVKMTKPSSDEYEPQPFIVVSLGFKYRPPTILLVQDGRQTALDEKTAHLVDTMEFRAKDVVVRGREWSNAAGNCGIKAWLKTFVGVVEVDDIQRKYANLHANEED